MSAHTPYAAARPPHAAARLARPPHTTSALEHASMARKEAWEVVEGALAAQTMAAAALTAEAGDAPSQGKGGT